MTSSNISGAETETTENGWQLDVDHAAKFPVPNFIRLFIIRRVLSTYMKNSKAARTGMKIKNLIKKRVENKATQAKVDKILSPLMTHGLKRYMRFCYTEEEHASMIEMIFNEIILIDLAKEYQVVITHQQSRNCNSLDNGNMNVNVNNNKNNKNDSEYYQELVFNTNDLMYSIFQYISDYDGEWPHDYSGNLVNCSLVCSHWLYHVFNPKSIYFFNLTDLIETTQKLCANMGGNGNGNGFDNNINIRRMWQRLVNVKKVAMHLSENNYGSYDIERDVEKEKKEKISNLLLSRLSMLGNVEWIDSICPYYKLAILKAIIQNCRKKIAKYEVRIEKPKENENGSKSFNPQPLKLWNANYIWIGSFALKILWSDACDTLVLNGVRLIDQEWCNYVINNCDCSGIKTLNLSWNTFDELLNNSINNQSTRLLFNKLAKKFENLRKLKIGDGEQFDECILLFLRSLKPIIVKNDIKVELQVYSHLAESSFDELNNCIQQSEAKIDKIELQWNRNKHLTQINKLIQVSNTKSNLKWLHFNNWDETREDHLVQRLSPIGAVTELLNDYQSLCGKMDTPELALQLQVLEFDDAMAYKLEPMNDIKQFLNCGIVNQTDGLFVIMSCNVVIKDDSISKEKVSDFFKIVFSLMVEKRMAIDIKVKFKGLNDRKKFDKYYNEVYLLYFDYQKVLKDYKVPKCNTYCHPLQWPQMSFDFMIKQEAFSRKTCVFHVVNVER